MPAAARFGDLIGHAPPIPPATAGARIGAALLTGGLASLGIGALVSAALVGARSASGSDSGKLAGDGNGGARGGGGVGGVPTGKIIGPCSGNVFTNGIPAARAHLDLTVCSLHPPVPLQIASGSSNVFINGMPAARKGDSVKCSAIIITGSGNVFIGGSGGGSGGTVQTDPIMSDGVVSSTLERAVLMADAGAAARLQNQSALDNQASANLLPEIAQEPARTWDPRSLMSYSAETERQLRATKIGPHAVAWDGVVRENPALSYARSTGAFDPRANTMEAKVGPVIQPLLLGVLTRGASFYADGGLHFGRGAAQIYNGERLNGAGNLLLGTLDVAGGAGMASARNATGANSVVELSPGALLRQKHGHLTAGERQAIIFARTEEIARQQLLAKTGGHFMERHAPNIPLRDQLVSAATGRRPDGKIMMKGSNPNKRFTVDSTQFYTYKDMLYGINRAERIQQHAISIGQPVNGYISLKYSDFVGGGFVKNSPLFGASDLSKFYGKTPYANFGVDPFTGRAITAYPVLSRDGLGTLY